MGAAQRRLPAQTGPTKSGALRDAPLPPAGRLLCCWPVGLVMARLDPPPAQAAGRAVAAACESSGQPTQTPRRVHPPAGASLVSCKRRTLRLGSFCLASHLRGGQDCPARPGSRGLVTGGRPKGRMSCNSEVGRVSGREVADPADVQLGRTPQTPQPPVGSAGRVELVTQPHGTYLEQCARSSSRL